MGPAAPDRVRRRVARLLRRALDGGDGLGILSIGPESAAAQEQLEVLVPCSLVERPSLDLAERGGVSFGQIAFDYRSS